MSRIWKFRYWMRGVWTGIKGMRRVQIGSRVKHDGRLWFVSNWANSPRMNLSEGTRLGGSGEYRELVPREDIRETWSLSEFAHRFRIMYRWYMNYWWLIDVNKKLHPEAFQ